MTVPRWIFLILAIGAFGAAITTEASYRLAGGEHDWVTQVLLILFGLFCVWVLRK